MRRFAGFYLFIFFILISALPVMAEDNGPMKLSYAEDRWIAVHYFMQAQIFTQNGYESSGSNTWTKSADLRRSRIILNGQVTKNIDFFMDTEDFLVGNQGAGSQYSTTTNTIDSSIKTKDSKGLFTQDAYINYKVFEEAFQVTVGLMPIPFMHQNMESPISLLGVDYNNIIIPLDTTSNNWRDTGLELRGIVKTVLEYRLGLFRGQPRFINTSSSFTQNENPDAWPRVNVRLQFNLLDAETGFFYSENYLGKKNILSVGGGIDWQHNAVSKNGKLDDYMAFTADATADYKFSDNLVGTFQGGWLSVSNEPGTGVSSQWGLYSQAGVLLYNAYQPYLKYQFWDGFNMEAGRKVKNSYISGGLSYFINGHNANIKLEYQNPIFFNNHLSGEKKAVLQFQIFI